MKHLELTPADRPCLLPEETLLFVQDAVGLYQGKYKIPSLQNGKAYLTTHRACYVDDLEPRRNPIAIELKSVDGYDFYPRWFKSSPKVTLHPKAARRLPIQGRCQSTTLNLQIEARSPTRSSNASPIHNGGNSSIYPGSGSSTPRPSNATWVCTICSFVNPVPSNFDPATANPNMILQPCLSCGIKPSFPHILKAAVKNAAGRQFSQSTYQALAQPLVEPDSQYNEDSRNEYYEVTSSQTTALPQIPRFQCPRCTFLNHPSLLTCEMCGLSLSSIKDRAPGDHGEYFKRPESPGPTLDGASKGLDNDTECVKFSFRAGGEKGFCEKLKGAMVQRKWLLQHAPPVPDPYQYPSSSYASGNGMTLDGRARPPSDRPRAPGIAGLEAKGLELRKKNEAMIGSAFEDLDALMASAKEIVALAESFAKKSDDGSADADQIIADSAKALSMVTTKNMLGSSAGSESLYLSELSRNLAEYLTDDSKSVLRKEGGIMSLVDLWAVFNRARGGVELISPLEFEKAARLWEKLKLPVRLRQFKNGLLVVQQADRTDDKTIAQLLTWLQEMHSSLSNNNVPWDVEAFGRGITAQEAAQRFGWSVGVANEELEMAEEKGALCREEGVEGLRFWENWIMNDDTDDEDNDGINVDPLYDIDPIKQNLEDMGLF